MVYPPAVNRISIRSCLQVLCSEQRRQRAQHAGKLCCDLHQPSAADRRLLVLMADHAHCTADTGESTLWTGSGARCTCQIHSSNIVAAVHILAGGAVLCGCGACCCTCTFSLRRISVHIFNFLNMCVSLCEHCATCISAV
jgi:hypothetical protein